jgi:hypothetical protein
MIDYDKLTTDHRVCDNAGNWYTVHEIGWEYDPHKKGYTPRPLITFRRESDGATMAVNREGYMLTAAHAELREDTLVTPGAIVFKGAS